MKKIFYLIVFGSIAAVACTKSKTETDTNPPVVSINKPVDGNMFKSGDSVQITGDVSDEELHEMDIYVKNASTDSEYFHQTPYIHELQNYHYNEYWVVPVLKDTIEVELKVEAQDHHDHSTEKKLKFKVRP